MRIHPISDDDLPFLAEMTLLAVFPPGPLPQGAAEMPRVTRWTAEWGRNGDGGVIALHDGVRLGAAWCRIQAGVVVRDGRGNAVPEVAIAVLPEQRSRGIGTSLLAALEREASSRGYAGLCLSVDASNPALRLYERAGFELVRRDGDRLTMAKRLT
jgi:ribosomal protein S18 acetylase RimI-like enzyme